MEIETAIALKRVKIPNSHWPAYQLIRFRIKGSEVLDREFIDKPDVLEMVLAKAQDALDPESVVAEAPPTEITHAIF